MKALESHTLPDLHDFYSPEAFTQDPDPFDVVNEDAAAEEDFPWLALTILGLSCWGIVWLLAVVALLLGYRKLRTSRHAQLTSNLLIDALLKFTFVYMPGTLKLYYGGWTQSDLTFCRFYNLISVYTSFTLPWALVINSINVTLCAYSPLRHRNITTKWFFIVLLIFPWSFSFVVTLALMLHDAPKVGQIMHNFCTFPMFNDYGHFIRFALTSQFFKYLIPAAFILLFTILSIIYTRRNVRILARHEEASGRLHLLAITLSAIALNLLYLLIVTPWNIFMLMSYTLVLPNGHLKRTGEVLHIIHYFFLTNIPLLWLTLQPEITLPVRGWLKARCLRRRSLQTDPQNLVVIDRY